MRAKSLLTTCPKTHSKLEKVPLNVLMEGKDENGQPLGREDFTGEAMTQQLVAGKWYDTQYSCTACQISDTQDRSR
jgi:hypothetical protein